MLIFFNFSSNIKCQILDLNFVYIKNYSLIVNNNFENMAKVRNNLF